jgi:hypothetical protein
VVSALRPRMILFGPMTRTTFWTRVSPNFCAHHAKKMREKRHP